MAADMFNGVEIPVAADKNGPLLRPQGPEKIVNGRLNALIFHLVLHAGPAGHAVLQFLQGTDRLLTALGGGEVVEAFQRQVSDNPPHKGGEPFRPLGRDGVPQAQPGVVDALLAVLRAGQDVLGNVLAQPAIFYGGLPDGLLGPFPVELYDLSVLHNRPPLFVLKSAFTLLVRFSVRRLQYFL